MTRNTEARDDAPTYEEVLGVDERRTWYRIANLAAAVEEGEKARHAVEHYFAFGTARGDAFYSLRDPSGLPIATVMVSNETGMEHRTIVAGPGNTCPWPDHADALDALSELVGRPIDASHAVSPTPLAIAIENGVVPVEFSATIRSTGSAPSP